MRCPTCGFDNPEGMTFCGECAAPLKSTCPNCGFNNPPGFKFCGSCGTSLTGAPRGSEPQRGLGSSLGPKSYTPAHLAQRILTEQAALEARAAVDGERKTITALFADIKGSMEMLETLDPEEARSIVDPALQIMMDAVHRYEGYVAQSLGDGIFALFGAPIAQEDHPRRTLYAALRMQKECKRYAEQLRREKGINLQVRVGVNTGEVVVRSIRKDDLHTDYVPVGHSTGLAARVESLATPGSIVVTEHTYKLTEGYFQFKSLGPAQIKGVTGLLPIYEVVGVGPLRTRLQVAARRGLVRFVGRGTEMDQMRKALELAKKGRGQIVAVVGEAGLGKSRLFYEFKLVSLSGCLVLETFSVSHGKALPYLPLVDLLKGYFAISVQDDERQKQEKITGKVLTLDRNLEDILPFIFALLGVPERSSHMQQMDPQTKRHRTFEAVKRLLVRESLNQPLMVIVEDLHWLDGESEAFLSLMCETVASARILLLLNYRPEYQHTWAGKTYYTQLRLDPLGEEDAEELLSSLVGDSHDLRDLRQLLLAKTEGNPFFMEEIVQSLFDQGILVRKPAVTLTKLLTEIQIPPTVQGVLHARMDRLAPEEKALLQTLSVLGKQFSFSLLRRVVDLPERQLDRLLDQLQAEEFVFEQPAFPEPEYTFKHALTQEVAYRSLLAERRSVLHEGIAQAIEEIYAGRLEEQYDELAHHYSLSGNASKAVEYLQTAGEHALRKSAHVQAIEHLQRGLVLLNTQPLTNERQHQELGMQMLLGSALMAAQGYSAPDVEQTFLRARELCEELGETSRLGGALMGLAVCHMIRGDIQITFDLGQQLMAYAQKEQDVHAVISAHLVLGFANTHLGEIGTAREHLEESVALYDAQQHDVGEFIQGQNPAVACLCFLAIITWLSGYPDQALRRIQETLRRAQELQEPLSLALVLSQAAQIHWLRGEMQLAQEKTNALKDLSSEYGLKFWAAQASHSLGHTLSTLEEQKEKGLAQIEESFEELEATGAGLGKSEHLATLAQSYGRLGEKEKAMSLIAQAEAEAEKQGTLDLFSELHRARGRILVDLFGDQNTEAESCFRKAVEIASRNGAKSLELKATTSLARLLKKQGKHEEARVTLSEIYGWFTEGFDTADLKKARRLLDELAEDALART